MSKITLQSKTMQGYAQCEQVQQKFSAEYTLTHTTTKNI